MGLVHCVCLLFSVAFLIINKTGVIKRIVACRRLQINWMFSFLLLLIVFLLFLFVVWLEYGAKSGKDKGETELFLNPKDFDFVLPQVFVEKTRSKSLVDCYVVVGVIIGVSMLACVILAAAYFLYIYYYKNADLETSSIVDSVPVDLEEQPIQEPDHESVDEPEQPDTCLKTESSFEHHIAVHAVFLIYILLSAGCMLLKEKDSIKTIAASLGLIFAFYAVLYSQLVYNGNLAFIQRLENIACYGKWLSYIVIVLVMQRIISFKIFSLPNDIRNAYSVLKTALRILTGDQIIESVRWLVNQICTFDFRHYWSLLLKRL